MCDSTAAQVRSTAMVQHRSRLKQLQARILGNRPSGREVSSANQGTYLHKLSVQGCLDLSSGGSGIGVCPQALIWVGLALQALHKLVKAKSAGSKLHDKQAYNAASALNTDSCS